MSTFHVPAPLIPIALFYLLCATISLIGNTIMILCFFREKKFHSPCHYMITLTCAADMLHLCGHYLFNYQLFIGGPSSQELCFWLLLPSCIGIWLGEPLLVSMGIDRYLAIRFAVFYRNHLARSSAYLLSLFLFPIIYISYFTISAFLQRDPNTLVVCQVPLAMSGTSFEVANKISMLINTFVVLIYVVTYLKLREVSGNTQLKAIFKSISTIVVLVLVGWFAGCATNVISVNFVDDVDLQSVLMIYSGIGLNVACASNVFVFYMINSQYHEAIRKLFGLSVPLSSHQNVSVVKSTEKS